MIKGFSINITNTTQQEQYVELFKTGGLPMGVTVFVNNNNDYNYDSLLLMAQTQGFAGDTVYTDESKITQLHLFNKASSTTVMFNMKLENTPIIIDGFLNYIALTVSANTEIFFSLT